MRESHEEIRRYSELEGDYKQIKRFENYVEATSFKIKLTADLSAYKKEVETVNKSLSTAAKESFTTMFPWATGSNLLATYRKQVEEAISELRNMDSILTEIGKSGNYTASALKALGENSFQSASAYGKKASEYLQTVQSISRSAFDSKEVIAISELSMTAQAAGNMSADLANNYLVVANVAYDYGSNVEKLSALLDGQNEVAKKSSISMTELATATNTAATAMSHAGLSEAEMTALLASGLANTSASGEAVGLAMNNILSNLQQVNKSTSFSGGAIGDVVDEDTLERIRKNLHSYGIELKSVHDGITKLRNPLEILKELSKVYNSLPDGSTEKKELLADIGGRNNAAILKGILTNWDAYETYLNQYSDSSGSAMKDAMASANSWEGSVNKLSNTWTQFMQNFMQSDNIITTINTLNSLLKVLDKLVGAIGAFPSLATIYAGIMAYKGMG